MKGLAENLKSILIILLVVALALMSALRLMEIQVVGDDTIKNQVTYSADAITYTKQVKAARGEILDYNSNIIVTNEPQSNLVLEKAFFPSDLKEGNKTLLGIYNALKDRGYEYKDSLPITPDRPYVFTVEDSTDVIENLNLNVYATAENCVDKLISDNEIDESYSDEEKRIIAGMRYDMIEKDFAYSNDLVLAEDIDETSVIEFKELSNFYKGIDIAESSSRKIERGDILPHEIGTVGPIYAEEYDELKSKGYAMNDSVGKSGIESAMETQLRGQNGEEELIVEDGLIKSDKPIEETVSGETIKLTVDGNYQLKLQGILENFLTNFPSINPRPESLKNVRLRCYLRA